MLKIEILWAEDAVDDVFEVVNNDGNRVGFFVRHAGFAVSHDDDDPTKPLNDNDQGNNQVSDHSVNEQNNNLMEDENVGNMGNISATNLQQDVEQWDSEATRDGPSRYGLDDAFENALKDMGLTSVEKNVELARKQAGSDLAEPSVKRTKNILSLATLDLKVDLHGSPSLPRTMVDLGTELLGDSLGQDAWQSPHLDLGSDRSRGKRSLEETEATVAVGSETTKKQRFDGTMFFSQPLIQYLLWVISVCQRTHHVYLEIIPSLLRLLILHKLIFMVIP